MTPNRSIVAPQPVKTSIRELVLSGSVIVAMCVGAATLFTHALDQKLVAEQPPALVAPALSVTALTAAAKRLEAAYPGVSVVPLRAGNGLVISVAEATDFHIWRAVVLSAETAARVPFRVQNMQINGVANSGQMLPATAAIPVSVELVLPTAVTGMGMQPTPRLPLSMP